MSDVKTSYEYKNKKKQTVKQTSGTNINTYSHSKY